MKIAAEPVMKRTRPAVTTERQGTEKTETRHTEIPLCCDDGTFTLETYEPKGDGMAVIAVDNQKGGVGKTTLTFNLAKGFAARGQRILAIDNDPQANLTRAFLAHPKELRANILTIYENEHSHLEPQQVGENLYLIGSDLHLARVAERDFEVIYQLREGLEVIKNHYDMVLIDCLPSFGFLNMAALNAANYVFIPTTPSPFALFGLKDLFDAIAKIQKRMNPELRVLGIVLNLVEGRATTIARELEEALRETDGAVVVESIIHKSMKLAESPAWHQSILEYEPKSKMATEFHRLMDEINERITA